MQVVVSTRDCRTAVTAALEDARVKLVEERETHRKNAFDRLHNGAVHNGLHVDEARRKEMNEMVDRDVEHIMERHPFNELIKLFEVQLKMLDYTSQTEMMLDEGDFHTLGDYLPAREKAQAA